MSIERVAPEHIKVSDAETALKVTQTGSGNAFVVEDSESPDSSAFVIDNQGRVGIKKTPTRDLDVDGLISAANIIPGYATIATSGGSTTLTVTSAQQQFFTGSQSHTVVLPVASTLGLGHFFTIHNNSTGALTINSSGGNLVRVVGPNTTAQLTCILASGTTAASWDVDLAEGSAYATTVTANGTTTLSVSSAQRQFFTGTQNQTVVLPVVSTLTLGQFYIIENNSSGSITVQSSGLNAVVTVPANRSVQLTAIATTGTGAAAWDVEYGGASTPLATTAFVQSEITALINAAPATLDTLNELAAALGNDANFATTVTNALAGKVNDTGDTITGELIISANTSGDALRVTQTGAGDALRVEDEANPDGTPFIVKSDGAVGIGTATPTEKLSVVGDISATGDLISDGIDSSLAQSVLSESVFWIDAARSGFNSQSVQNLGTGGAALNAQLGSIATADSNDPTYLSWSGTNYVYIPAVAVNALSVPHVAGAQVGDNLDLRVDVTADTWNPGAVRFLMGKASGTTAATTSFSFSTNTTNRLLFQVSDGTTLVSANQTVLNAAPFTTATRLRLRATYERNTGSGQYAIRFFYNDSDFSTPLNTLSTWVQVGTTVTGTSVGATLDVNTPLRVGNRRASTDVPLGGIYHRGSLLVDSSTVLNVLTSSVPDGSATSFTAATGQIVSIARSTGGLKTVAVTQPTWLFGTDDYMEVSDNNLLDSESGESFTVVWVGRQWATPVSSGRLISKQGLDASVGWSIRQNATSTNVGARLNDGVLDTGVNSNLIPAGSLTPISMVVDRSANTLRAYTGSSFTQTTISSLASLANSLPLRIGRTADTDTFYQNFELFSALVIRRALTEIEVAALNTYFTTRPPLGEALVVKAPTFEVQGNVQVTGTGNRFIGSGAVYNVTSTTRPANPVEGDVIYERDTRLFFGWDGTLWKSIGGGAKGGGNDDVFYENSQAVTVNYAITTNKNAMTAGPVSINSGVTVEIPAGSVWTIV